MLPQKPKQEKLPWKNTINHGVNLNSDIKRLPTNQLSNANIYRTHLLPRSYDERVKHELHPRGFKMTGKTCKEFPQAGAKLETKVGRERLERAEATFNETVARKKDEYDHFMANKRTIFAERMEPRFAPPANDGKCF